MTWGQRRFDSGALDGAAAAPEELYLDLLQRCLTASLEAEELQPIRPRGPWRGRVWALAHRLLDVKQLDVVRRVPVSAELRADGRDWPSRGETMVGLRRLGNIRHCVSRVIADGIPGDLLEAGTWRGGSAIFMRGALLAYGDTTRTVWVADSFQGLPPPDPRSYPADAGDEHYTWPELAVPLSQVKANFAKYGLLDDRVRFLEGWFKDTLADARVERLSILRVDGDMYESTIDTLSPLYPRVSPGGFVIIDDYGYVASCRKAVDEYREEHGITEPLQEIDWTGVYWRKRSGAG